MSASIEVKIFSKPKKVAKGIAKELFRIISETNQKRFDIAFSGGKSPAHLFEILNEKYHDLLPWERIHAWWVDERCVPPDHPDSNYKLCYDLLLSNVNILEENIHRIKGEILPEDAAEDYTNQIQQLNFKGDWPVFDLIMLGLGADGHTASIFPDQMDLIHSEDICAVATHPKTGQKRVTLTGQAINHASRIFFLVTGIEKSKHISDIMNDDETAKLLPAYYIEPVNGNLIWYIDDKAAMYIS